MFIIFCYFPHLKPDYHLRKGSHHLLVVSFLWKIMELPKEIKHQIIRPEAENYLEPIADPY